MVSDSPGRDSRPGFGVGTFGGMAQSDEWEAGRCTFGLAGAATQILHRFVLLKGPATQVANAAGGGILAAAWRAPKTAAAAQPFTRAGPGKQ